MASDNFDVNLWHFFFVFVFYFSIKVCIAASIRIEAVPIDVTMNSSMKPYRKYLKYSSSKLLFT